MAEAPNDTGKEGHDETNKVSGEGPANTSETPATSAALSEGSSISVQGGDAMTGSGEGSNTRAGSPQGGSASGAEDAPSMAGSVSPEDAGMAGGAIPEGRGASPASETLHADAETPRPTQGEAPADEERSFDSGNRPRQAGQEAVTNVGSSNLGPHGDPAEGKRDQPGTGGDDVDAATG